MEYFIKFKNSPEYRWLIKERPTAFVLLSLVASRAKTSNDHPEFRLEVGEAYLGDYKNYGVTERIYRTDKSFLENANFVTTRTTNKGTIIKIVSSSIFELYAKTKDDPVDRQETDKRRLTKNEKNEKNIYSSLNSLTETVCYEIATNMRLKPKDVLAKKDSLVDYCGSTGKKYKNYKLALQNWLRRDLENKKIELNLTLAEQVAEWEKTAND